MNSAATIRVLIADDHPVFRAGLRSVVQESGILDLAGEAGDGEEAVALASTEQPDVVLMDISMPRLNGTDAARRVLEVSPGTAILMLSMLEDDSSVFAAMRAGARGYLLKGAAPDDIVRAVVSAAAGDAIFSPALAARMRHFFMTGHGGASHPFPDLSPREREVLDLVASGDSNARIAARLGLSEKTVRNNVSLILTKLQAADRSSAIVRAREAGLGDKRDG